MLIFREKERVALLLWNGHRYDLLLRPAATDGLSRALLAPEREKILILARDVKFFGDVFAGFRHRINTVLCFHQGIYKSPAERGVFQFHGARIGAVRLGDDEGSSRHALDASGNHEIGLTAFDGSRSGGNGVHARTAKPVNRCARHFFRQTRQQERHPSNISVVFARLIGTAVDDIVHGVPIYVGVTLDEGLKRNRCEIIRANRGKRSTIPPEGCPNGVADVCGLHSYPWNFGATYLIRKSGNVRHLAEFLVWN